MSETVTILRSTAGAADEYGTPGPGTVTSTVVPALGIAPRTSDENNNNQSTVYVGLTVYLPAGTVISKNDRVTVRGQTYEVEGDPGVWRSPFTDWDPGIEVALTRSG